MRDLRGFVTGYATQLAVPSIVDGIAVGSVPDLMATKLDVIQHRQQGRDYIDIAALDRARRLHHRRRPALPQTALRPHRHLRRDPAHRPTRHQRAAHRPRPRLRPLPRRGCQPPRRTPARRPRLGAAVRAAATPTTARTQRTRTLTLTADTSKAGPCSPSPEEPAASQACHQPAPAVASRAHRISLLSSRQVSV
ncbi:MAG: hypothetical protein F4076_13670 [Acidimicrobiaceae bacterium]|nr:hypothetical protein [Acidimicrobiaceae bacterium]MYE76676.1 hypothetical protein [Acidimicrobiaceae bacterium]MYH43069.1 hypothetical protein [Acidimicrobiaceae bacterium]MYJ43459.1 hypothetical protein [Acidimicrobiaceae bacterium]